MNAFGVLPAAVQRALADFPFPVACAVVVEDGVWAGGDTRTSYPWMSVTKLVTARAALAAVDAGEVDLDDTLTPAGATLEMLLAHAGGLSATGEQVTDPVTQRIYSNAGYDVLGQALARESDIGAILLDHLHAWGATDVSYASSPAWGLRGSLADLVALTAELARPGHLDPHLAAFATRPAWPGLAGILPGYGDFADNAWGLGPEIRGTKRPHWTAPDAPAHVFGHFGQSGSFVWVDQPAGVAACFLSAERFGLAHQRRWPDINAAIMRAFA